MCTEMTCTTSQTCSYQSPKCGLHIVSLSADWMERTSRIKKRTEWEDKGAKVFEWLGEVELPCTY